MVRLIIVLMLFWSVAPAFAQIGPSGQNRPGLSNRFFFDEYKQMLAGEPRKVEIVLNSGAHLDLDGQADIALETRMNGRLTAWQLAAPSFGGQSVQPQIAQTPVDSASPTRAECLKILAALRPGASAISVESHNAPRYYCVRTTLGLYGRLTLQESTGSPVNSVRLLVELWR